MAEDNNNQNQKEDDALGKLRQQMLADDAEDDADSDETKQEDTQTPAPASSPPPSEQDQTEPETIPKDKPARAKKTRPTSPFVLYTASLFMALGALIFVGSQSYRMGMQHASQQKQQQEKDSAQTMKAPAQTQSRSPHHDVARMVEQTQRPQTKTAEQKKPQQKTTQQKIQPKTKQPAPTVSATPTATKTPRTSTSAESLARIQQEIALIKKRQQKIQASLKKTPPPTPTPTSTPSTTTTKKQPARAATAIPSPLATARQQPIRRLPKPKTLADKQTRSPAPPTSPTPRPSVQAEKKPKRLAAIPLSPPPQNIARDVPALSPEERNRYRVQLGAHRNKIDTHNQWLQVLYKHSQVLAPYEARVERLVRKQAPQSIYYRLQVIGFPNKTTAQNICNQLKRRRENCWVVTPEKQQP